MPAVWLQALVWSGLVWSDSAVQPFLTFTALLHFSLGAFAWPSSFKQTLNEDRGKVLRLVCLLLSTTA